MEATKVFDRSQNYLVLLLVLLAASASFVGAEQVGFKQVSEEHTNWFIIKKNIYIYIVQNNPQR